MNGDGEIFKSFFGTNIEGLHAITDLKKEFVSQKGINLFDHF